jgi:uncharacterized protein with von Willebrand factor type A (vWA) domain
MKNKISEKLNKLSPVSLDTYGNVILKSEFYLHMNYS